MSDKKYVVHRQGGQEIAYTLKGFVIGSRELAELLCDELGIVPELARAHHGVCSIGFSAADQLWHAWIDGLRASFGIGSTVAPGDIAYRPATADELIQEYVEAVASEEKYPLLSTRMHKQALVRQDCTPLPHNRGILIAAGNRKWPVFCGRGAWTAETLDDARQMAVDYVAALTD